MTIPDVSHWEELSDWQRAHDEGGVTHTAIMATYGRHGGDPYALRNWIESGRRSIVRALLMWPHPAEGDPILQVRNFAQFAKALGYDPGSDWFVAGDIEERNLLTADFAYAIESEIEQQLQTPAWLYVNPDIIANYFDKRLRRFKLMLAAWSSAATPIVPAGYDLGLWQYTRAGIVPGINDGRPTTDLNRLPSTIVIPQEPAIYFVEVTAPVGLHIRSGPGVNFGIIDSLKSGDRVSVYDESGNWLRILPAITRPAWVSASYTRRIA